MTLRFVLMVNKQGQTRLSQYYPSPSFPVQTIAEKNALEGEIIRKCLSRTETQCSFFDGNGFTCVYRRYASLFFIVGIDKENANELGALEFIHRFVEILDEYYVTVCELDVRLEHRVLAPILFFPVGFCRA
jgi:AP-4 complex subunit sigma-1